MRYTVTAAPEWLRRYPQKGRFEARFRGGTRTSRPDRGTALVPEPPLTRQGIAWLVF